LTTAAHIAVVDDDPDVRSAVADYLMRNGFAVSVADGADAFRAILAERAVDLAILDINMPGDDGLMLARELRGQGTRTGIIMLTANDGEIDRVIGLEIGADDYVAKPWSSRELLARVRAVLRRAAVPAPESSAAPREVAMGKCRLNLSARRLYAADGSEVPLTAGEFDLLSAFAASPRRVLSRDQLLDALGSHDGEAFDRAIDNRITRIRRKIEREPANPSAIRTVRGAGYVFEPEGEGGAR